MREKTEEMVRELGVEKSSIEYSGYSIYSQNKEYIIKNVDIQLNGTECCLFDKEYNFIFNKCKIRIGIKHKQDYSNIYFEECELEDFSIDNSKYMSSINTLNFRKCIFKKKVDLSFIKFINLNFSHNIFKEDVDFYKCVFGEENSKNTIDLSSIVFEKNVKFDEAEFVSFATFHTTSFRATASFYKTKFDIIPNFSPADFQGILNINLAEFGKGNKGFEYSDISKLVDMAYSSKNTPNTEEKKIQNSINIRDSFRGIKDKLIKQSNILEAQKFHKAELYCKEIEFEKNDYLSLKEKIEFLLLKFYRITSEHHTNFIRIFECILWLICVFGIVSLIFSDFSNEYVFMAFVVLSILYLICIIFSKTHFSDIIMFFIAVIFIVFWLLTKKFFINLFEFKIILILSNLVVVIVFITLFFMPFTFIKICKNYSIPKYAKTFFKMLLYGGASVVISINLNVVNPILGTNNMIQDTKNLDKELNKLGGEKIIEIANIIYNSDFVENITEAKNIIRKDLLDYNATDKNIDIIILKKKLETYILTKSISNYLYLAFYLILILLIFSLQKTARKNSIIPQ